MNEEADRAYQELKAVPLPEFEEGLEYARYLRDFYTEVIRRRTEGSYLEVFYEELFTGDIQTSRDAARKVFQFLGLDLPDTRELDPILDPHTSKLNTAKTYALLPNAVTIDERFGNDDTGRLFEPAI
jgi:hypothetical protein